MQHLPFNYLAQSYKPSRFYGLYTVDGVGASDPAIAQFEFDNKGTVAVDELAALFYGVTPADKFTGLVIVVTVQQEAIIGNNADSAGCLSPTDKIPRLLVLRRFQRSGRPVKLREQ
ncbi:hypothetical protein LTR36_006492 [Oleoguttula mirabilis]|uniref:Uncharacterized protein n=1 Tax=Oleoguttula mirabilis TaxID=1507867 RepID=A0AAV9JUU3_9PEZI|nr:hypothetical protein LTR36_006492 [Oleoguttula mirabilis]